MKKLDNVEKVCLVIIFCVACLPAFYILIKLYHPIYRQSDYSEASEAEKKALSVFYDSDIISEGKCFDLKFIYAEPCTNEAVMEIVKKTDVDLGEINIKTLNENNDSIADQYYYNFEATKWLSGWEEGRKYLRYAFGDRFLNGYDTETKYEDNMAFKVRISYDGQEEDHELVFDLEKNIKELERHVKSPVVNTYEGQLASYYYGLLLSYDKERWFQEVNELIDRDKNKYLDYARILKTDVCKNPLNGYQDGDEQALYQFNDEEYAEYQRMVQRASDKGLFNENDSNHNR